MHVLPRTVRSTDSLCGQGIDGLTFKNMYLCLSDLTLSTNGMTFKTMAGEEGKRGWQESFTKLFLLICLAPLVMQKLHTCLYAWVADSKTLSTMWIHSLNTAVCCNMKYYLLVY